MDEPTKTIKISASVLKRALKFRAVLLAKLKLSRMSIIQLIDWLVTRALDIETKDGK